MSDSAKRRSRLPPRRRTPRRPAGKDYLSGLPLELFLPIVKYTIDNTSSKPLASLKSLSSCNKTIRAKCISSGLFQSLLVTLHRGPSTIRSIHQRLVLKTIPTFSIHSLTITEYIIRECPAELARLLQLLPQLRTLRIKGNRQIESSFSWDSLPPLKCGRLVSFNSLLYKTLSSKSRLRALECLEIIDCSITQVLIDVIAAIRSYSRLVWTRSHILHEPDLMQYTHCNVRTVQMSGARFGNDRWMTRFLSYTRISKSVEFLSLPETLVESIFAGLTPNSHVMPKLEGYPKLMTVHVLPPSLPRNAYLQQHGRARHQIVLRTVIWRVPSFLRHDDALYYQSFYPNVFIFECTSRQEFDFKGTLESSFVDFVKKFAFHQSAWTVIFHSKRQKFGIQFLKLRPWSNPGRFNSNMNVVPSWFIEPMTKDDYRILEPHEIEVILQEADQSLWPEIVETDEQKL